MSLEHPALTSAHSCGQSILPDVGGRSLQTLVLGLCGTPNAAFQCVLCPLVHESLHLWTSWKLLIARSEILRLHTCRVENILGLSKFFIDFEERNINLFPKSLPQAARSSSSLQITLMFIQTVKALEVWGLSYILLARSGYLASPGKKSQEQQNKRIFDPKLVGALTQSFIWKTKCNLQILQCSLYQGLQDTWTGLQLVFSVCGGNKPPVLVHWAPV